MVAAKPPFEEFYTNNRRFVLSYFAKLRGYDAAEDMAQEVFIKAWRAYDRFNPEIGSAMTWLKAISRNVLIDHWKVKTNNMVFTPLEDAVEFEHSRYPVEDLMDLARNYAQLNGEQQRLMALRAAGYTNKEVGEMTGIPKGTIGGLMLKVRRELERLDE